MIRRCSHLFLALSVLVGSGSAWAQDVDALYEQGQSAFEAGRFEEARSKFVSVWEQRKSYDVAAVLAQAELHLGRNGDAARHLAYAVAHFPVSASTDVRKKIEAAFEEVRGKVATLKVEASPASAALKINGRAHAEAERAEAIFVEPGQVTIELSADGYQPAKQTVDVKKGETREVKLALVPEAKPAERSFLGPGIAFGVGGAGLVLGAITGGVSLAQYGDVKTACGGGTTCPEAQRGNIESGKALAHVATVGFAIAAVGAAAGVTLLLVPIGGKGTTQARISVGPGSVSVKGAF